MALGAIYLKTGVLKCVDEGGRVEGFWIFTSDRAALLLFTEGSGAPNYENQGTKWHAFVLGGIGGIYMGSRMCIFEPDLHPCHFFQIKLGKEIRVAYQDNHA